MRATHLQQQLQRRAASCRAPSGRRESTAAAPTTTSGLLVDPGLVEQRPRLPREEARRTASAQHVDAAAARTRFDARAAAAPRAPRCRCGRACDCTKAPQRKVAPTRQNTAASSCQSVEALQEVARQHARRSAPATRRAARPCRTTMRDAVDARDGSASGARSSRRAVRRGGAPARLGAAASERRVGRPASAPRRSSQQLLRRLQQLRAVLVLARRSPSTRCRARSPATSRAVASSRSYTLAPAFA